MCTEEACDGERRGDSPTRTLMVAQISERPITSTRRISANLQRPPTRRLLDHRRRRLMAIAAFLLCSSFIAPARAISTSSLKPPWRKVDLVAAAETKDFSGEASNLFNNIRTPAALVAGASFGAAFALQPVSGESLAVGLCKRVYLLISVGAVSAELISVLVSSTTLGRLGSEGKRSASSGSVVDFLTEHYELECNARLSNLGSHRYACPLIRCSPRALPDLATQFNFQMGALRARSSWLT